MYQPLEKIVQNLQGSVPVAPIPGQDGDAILRLGQKAHRVVVYQDCAVQRVRVANFAEVFHESLPAHLGAVGSVVTSA